MSSRMKLPRSLQTEDFFDTSGILMQEPFESDKPFALLSFFWDLESRTDVQRRKLQIRRVCFQRVRECGCH